jgi:hypothetical protein
MTRRYIPVAETAKFVRKALKSAFPAIKFSVRSESYSGGSSIDVGWMDGPTAKMVDNVISQFKGSRFDGMIDLKQSRTHWLMPDGTAIVADDQGTEGSRGTLPAEHNTKPHPDAEEVRFAADHIFAYRRLSQRFLRQACARLVRHGHHEFANVTIEPETKDSGAYLKNMGSDEMTTLHRETVNLMIVTA